MEAVASHPSIAREFLASGTVSFMCQPIRPIDAMTDQRGPGWLEYLARPSVAGQPIAIEALIADAELHRCLPAVDLKLLTAALADVERDQHARTQVSLNVCAISISDPGFTRSLSRLLDQWSRTPPRLVFEITETFAIIHHGAANEFCRQMRERGIKIALDDVGVGQNNLRVLDRELVDILKLDRSILASPDPARVLRAYLDLAQVCQLETVCEGVETQEHLSLLDGLGIAYAQGFFGAGEPRVPAPSRLSALLTS